MLSRRSLLKTGAALTAGLSLRPQWLAAATTLPGGLILPTTAQIAWQEAEGGALVSLDISVMAGEYVNNNDTKKVFDPRLYNPAKLDTDQWIDAAKSAGAKYAVFTATHFNGFMQWQSDLYPYGLKQAAWRGGNGDVVGDFVASCRKAGIKPGLYLSTHRNAYQSVWEHYVDWGKGKGTPKQAAFNRIAEGMTEELCSRYGELIQIWFDAGVKTPEEGGPDVLPIFEKYQPNSVFYNSSKRMDHRWIGNEDGVGGKPCWATMPGRERGAILHNSVIWNKYIANGDHEGSVWSPAMADIVLRGKNNHDWFWRPGKDNTLYSVNELMGMYDTSAGRNCNFIIGLVVNNEGLVPEGDVKRVREFGSEVQRRYGQPLAETKGEGEEIKLELEKTAAIDTILAMEEIAQGERVSKYAVEGRESGGAWKQLCTGESIGHKRIQHFAKTEVSELRLRISQSVATPKILRFAAY